jgi:DNA-binding NtrC family response regulator
MNRILLSDDEPSIIRGLDLVFMKQDQYELKTASDSETAISILRNEKIDFVLTDLLIPEITNGISIIREAKLCGNDPVVLVMTGVEVAENIVQAMQAGADDLIIKGFNSNELLFRIENLLRKKEQIKNLTIQNTILKNSIQSAFGDYKIVGNSSDIKNILSVIKKVAQDASSTCLISGPSGSGKELIARIIHEQSRRNKAPFIPVNCAAIPENLIESELFGHEKGSFTGAISSRIGKFEQAGEGVIFLDEIGDLPPNLQMRLLRVLEEKTFTRVGSNTDLEMKAMVMAATNQDLRDKIKNGSFREDLFYRLNVINIDIPPLSKRKEDIKLLTKYYLQKLNEERNKKIKITESALDKMEKYSFPGNVRELRNIIENAFVLTETEYIYPDNLLFNLNKNKSEEGICNLFRLPYRDATYQFECLYFEHLLTKHRNKIAEAAKDACLSNEWFGKKLKHLGLK